MRIYKLLIRNKIIEYLLFLILIILAYYIIFDIFDQIIPVTKSDEVYYFIEKYNTTIQYNNNVSNKAISDFEEYYNVDNLDNNNLRGYAKGNLKKPIIVVLNTRHLHYTLNHETGHIFWSKGLSKEERNQYELYYNQTSNFTRYWFWSYVHKKDANEHFAEAFRCYFEKWRTCYLGLTKDQKTFLKNTITRELNEN